MGKLVLGERGSARMSYSVAYDMPASAHRVSDKSLGRGTLLSASLCSAVCKKTQGFVGFNPLGSEEANISKTETE